MRVTVSTSIIALQLLCAVQPAFAASVWSEDVGAYGAAIDYAKANNVLTPLGDGLWHPEMPLTRMDLIKSIVWSVYKEDINENCFTYIAPDMSANYTHLFRDVSRASVNAKEVCTAMFVGILQGRPDGSLKPEQGANLVETAKMVTKAYGIAPFAGLKPQPGVPWHEPFWYALARENAIPKSVLSRSSVLTRGEYAEIMYALRNEKPITGLRETTTKVSSAVQTDSDAETVETAPSTEITAAASPVKSVQAETMHARRQARLNDRLSHWANLSDSGRVGLDAVTRTGPLLY